MTSIELTGNSSDLTGKTGQLKFSRHFAMASAWTFTIKPIKELLIKFCGDGKNWIDPFAGDNSIAEFTNDIHPDRKAKYHLDSLDFCKMMNGPFNGILFDPPYSYRQISEHYKEVGKKATQLDTSTNFYNRIFDELTPKLKMGGYAISFGWNSNGFGLGRGFEKIEIMLIAHGGHHNDTIITVERKVDEQLKLFKE
jgi:hypothetical protein